MGNGTASPASNGVRELRLALVCYGGVSLAIYMHGVTKELQKLVAASALVDQATNPFDDDDSAAAWWDLLRGLREGRIDAPSNHADLTVRVAVDIIAGTSAGGINGLCLAKALAGNHSQDGLTTLWFERGDIGQLLGGPSWLPWQVKAGTRALLTFAFPTRARPPLRGDRMCKWVHDALTSMNGTNEAPHVSTLVPPGRRLLLFVPIVDVHGYNRDIPLYDPRFITDRTHRHVMSFTAETNENSQFGPEYDHALAFAARATSSIPGGFAPISFDDYAKAVGDDIDVDAFEHFFPIYRLAGHARPRDTQFIDGGVLDNFPFQDAIEAIPKMPAATEVDRRLLYVEPDPGEGTDPAGGPPLGLWRTVYAGVAAIPRHEPILDDMLALTHRNEQVLRLRDVIEANFDRIRHKAVQILDDATPGLPERPDAEDLADFWRRSEERAAHDADVAYPTYLRLRVRTVIDSYAAIVADALDLPPDSPQASFVTSAMRQWVRSGGLLAQDEDPDRRVQAAQEALLAGIDLQYHERRIRFLIAAVDWWYRDLSESGLGGDVPARAELDAAKGRFYSRLQDLWQIREDLRHDRTLANDVGRLFAPDEIADARSTDELAVEQFVEDRQQSLSLAQDHVERVVRPALPRVLHNLHIDLLDALTGWRQRARLDMLTRYLGFPFWDVLVFPLEALSGVNERDHVEVYRVSPRDVELLGSNEEERRTLEGERWFHFGAFFDRAGRERDYLWGRMDAAERLAKLLLDAGRAPASIAATTATPEQAPPQVPRDLLEQACKPVFAAILNEERERLHQAQDLIEKLDRQVHEPVGVTSAGP
jgi:patatin-related protein